jgi:uncharacterized protein (DUF1800 family)
MKPRCLARAATALLVAGVALAPLSAQTLSNLSTRAQVGTGVNTLVAGFTIAGGNKTLLLRAGGPALAQFGLTGTLANPKLELFRGDGTKLAENDDWGTPLGGATPVTAGAFSAVGAFAFPAGSRDAALLVTLPSGSYSAQVSGVNNTTGLAIVEAYEVGLEGGRLTNLSTRAQVGTGANVLIPGVVIAPGSGPRRLLVRAAGPALSAFNLPASVTLADPTVTVANGPGTPPFFASNDNWGTALGGALPAAVLSEAFTQAGAFVFPAGSRDAAVLVDVGPGSYTIQTSGVGNTSGLAIVEVYDVTPATSAEVSIAATDPTADESGGNPGEFTLTRTGDTSGPLTVYYGVGGSAVNGVDFPALLGSVVFPAGEATVKIPLVPNPDVSVDGLDTVVLTLSRGLGYTLGAQTSATVTIADSPATLYTAPIRTTTGAASSTAYGFATLMLSASGTLASVNVSFSNLSSAEVTAHLVIGSGEDYVMGLPNGQVAGAQWSFKPVGSYTAADLINGLKSGTVSVRIDSAKFPGGELKGTFVQTAGSTTFSAPPAAPAVALANITATDAARLLTQATFGPTRAEIDALTGGNIDAWISTQLEKPASSHRAATIADRTTFGGSGSYTNWNAIHPPNRQAAWFKIAVTGEDQLRQRMAFALSQIFVVSDQSLGDDSRAEPLAAYYDLLVNGAFGNFRTLLEQVTLNPLMGEYLSSLRNSKAEPATGQTPDENYAREVMQLFTIGLNQLQPDGTLKLGADALPIPTYNQTTITEMAKVFTGWSYPSTNVNAFRTAGANYFSPMQNYASNHDATAKNLSPVSATPIPAGQTGQQDLTLALDALYNHPNTAPFIAKQLIQRFVTSNPSPAYVYRVAQVFTAQKSSPTQLGAVVRAILTDYEARSPAVAANQSFGKLKEPLIRLAGLLRSFNASSASGRYLGYRVVLVDGTPITSSTPLPPVAERGNTTSGAATVSSATLPNNALGSLAQAALRSPTVFNFFHPDYVLPGELAKAGLVVPEFEITDDNFAINVPNFLRSFVIATVPSTAAGPYAITLNTTYEQTLAANPGALLDHLNTVLCAGTMPAATKTRITAALAAMAASATALDRVNTALLLTLTSPTAAVQK